MVRLEEVEDETFNEKPLGTKDDALLADDDDDYTDTDSEISSPSDLGDGTSLTYPPDETLLDRLIALKDIIPPKTRARISSATTTIANATATGITYSGKGIWVIATSVLLVGIPYALALSEEQQLMEEERQRGMMSEGAQGMMDAGGEAKAAL